jgi:hypothetical protein
MMRRTLALLALTTALAPSPAPAQPPPEPPPTAIVLRPAAEPRPALRYRLVPERADLVPGNAAIFYHRAIQMASERRTRLDADRKAKEPPPARPVPVDEQFNKWISGPIAEVPVDQARAMLETFLRPLLEIEQGAMRSTCDWEFDHRPEGISLLLPDIQEMRSLSRLVALRARLAILDGKTDEAMHWIEAGLVMGRHVARGPIIIQALVGIAIDFQMIKCLEDLIQAPGAPNLYWALADRPRPFIDMREAYEGERHLLEKEIPGLLELDRGPWGIDQARRFADELQRKLYSFDSGKAEGSTAQQLGIAAMTAKVYPEARRALIAQGRPEAEVEAMPVVQVASLYSYQEYRRLLDEKYKWLNVPYWQSVGRADAPHLSAERKMANPLLAMLWSLTPALDASRLAALRLNRQLDAIQCIEAIRLHAAAHDGKLPASLEAIADAPAPLDPATGKPFHYMVDGDSATLSAPLPPGGPQHPSYMIRYALKLAR